MKIKTKIILGFTFVILCGLIIGGYTFYSTSRFVSLFNEQVKLQNATKAIFKVLDAHYVWRQNLNTAIFTDTEFTGSYDPNTCALGKWRISPEATETADATINSLLTEIDAPHHEIHEEASIIMEMVKNGQQQAAENELINNLNPKAEKTIAVLTKMTEHYQILLQEKTKEVQGFQVQVLSFITILLVLSIIISISVAWFVIRGVMNPLKQLSKDADIVASGVLAVNLSYNANDEIGMVYSSFKKLVDTFKNLISDMNKIAEQHQAGDIEYFESPEKYQGEFQNIIRNLNNTIQDYVHSTIDILNTMQAYSNGDFTAQLPPFPGKKILANQVLDSVANQLRDVENSVMKLVNSALNGELTTQLDASNFKGDWKIIIDGMNKLMQTVNEPLQETQNVLQLVSSGQLDTKVSETYKGQFNQMAVSLNRTMHILSSYINEISFVLKMMAQDNLDIEMKQNYVGQFMDIKISFDEIIGRLNNVVDEISEASEQVSLGANHIAETSTTLSERVTEQASSVEELNATIDNIYQQTTDNAKNTSQAKSYTDIAKTNAENGNLKMRSMLTSMEEINTSSSNISKIIRVIEDIAFQTNLLALNAAVEAARAGTHGKGFAVVAEEVRSLAMHSQEAVKEITVLIEQSISKVNEGTVIANDTADALQKIVEGVSLISEFITKIEVASKEQSDSIRQVTDGIGLIAQITQENSATSQENAALAEELSGQSETLKSMVRRFTIKPRSK